MTNDGKNEYYFFLLLDPTEEEPLTLGKLIDINAFQHEERIQEISGQASSEAGLESILKRVRFLHY